MGVHPGSLPQSAAHAGNDEPIHKGKTEKTGEETSSNNSTNGTFVVQIADQQFNEPEQNNFCCEGPQSKVDFIGIQAQQSDHWLAGGGMMMGPRTCRCQSLLWVTTAPET